MEKKSIKSEVYTLKKRVGALKCYREKVERWAGRVAPAITELQNDDETEISEEASNVLTEVRRELTDSMVFSKSYIYGYMDTFYFDKLVVSSLHDRVARYPELGKLERPLRHILSNLEKFSDEKSKIVLSEMAYNHFSKNLVNRFDDLLSNLEISSKQAIDQLENCTYEMLREVDYM